LGEQGGAATRGMKNKRARLQPRFQALQPIEFCAADITLRRILLLQRIREKRSGKAVLDMPPNDFPVLQSHRKPIVQ